MHLDWNKRNEFMSKAFQKFQGKAPLENVEWLWIYGYYDQPLVGLVTYEGNVYYSHSFDIDERGRAKYLVFQLPPDVLAKELERMKRFEEMVGTHWSPQNPEEHRGTPESIAEYYQTSDRNHDFNFPIEYPAIGWFVD